MGEWIIQGKDYLVNITAFVTAIVSVMVASIKLSSILGTSKIELAFMTRYEQTKYKVYTYIAIYIVLFVSEYAIAYVMSNLKMIVSFLGNVVIMALVAIGTIISFILVLFCSNIEKPIWEKVGQISFYVFWITISMINICASVYMFQHRDFISLTGVISCVAFLLVVGLYMLTYKIYDPNLAKAYYELKTGDVMCIYMANDKESVYVGYSNQMAVDNMSYMVKSIGYFEDEDIEIYGLNSLSRRLICDNRIKDLKKAREDEKYRKQLEKEYMWKR